MKKSLNRFALWRLLSVDTSLHLMTEGNWLSFFKLFMYLKIDPVFLPEKSLVSYSTLSSSRYKAASFLRDRILGSLFLCFSAVLSFLLHQ